MIAFHFPLVTVRKYIYYSSHIARHLHLHKNLPGEEAVTQTQSFTFIHPFGRIINSRNMNTNQQLSGRTRMVLEYVKSYQRVHGYAPSIQEIRQNTDLQSLRGVILQLDKLERAGYIRRQKRIGRAIQVLDISQPEKATSVPLVGEIHAGPLTLAEMNIEQYREIPEPLLKGRKDAFLLRVKGNSMNKAGFFPGDTIIVVPASQAQNGDVVIAYSQEEDGATLKKLKLVQGYFALVPQSTDPKYKPIIGNNIQIQGKVIGKLQN